jgi:VWFA-related protein
MKTRRVVLLLAALVSIGALILSPLTASGQGGLELVVDQTETDEFPVVRAMVTVIDENGIPVPGLDISNFKLFEDGQQVPITSVSPVAAEEAEISTALLIDISGSMSWPSTKPINDAKEAATMFVDQLTDHDYMAVVAFGSQVDLGEPFPTIDSTREIDFTNDKDSLKTLIASVEASDEWTALYDAIFKGVRMTTRQPPGNRAVLVLTDGHEDAPSGDEPGGSVLDREAPISEALRYGIPVFTIGLGTEVDQTYLSELALRTGGTYTSTEQSEALTPLFQSVLDRLKLRYLIEYSSEVLADGEEHSLQMEVSTVGVQDSDIATFVAGLPDVPAVRMFLGSDGGARDQQLQNGQQVDESLRITVQIDHRDPIDAVEYYVDGTMVYSATAEPYVFPWNTSEYGPLTHTIAVRVRDVDGDVGSGSIDLVLPAPPPWDWWDTVVGYWWVGGIVIILVAIVVALYLILRRRRTPQAVCSQCGARMGPDWLTCPACGASVSPPRQAPTEAGVFRLTAEEESTVADLSGVEDVTVPEMPSVAPKAPVPETRVMGAEERAFALLIVDKGERRGKQFELGAGETAIGRLGTNDIVISDPTVGRHQAKVRQEGTEFYIYDLASTNPTRVNGQEIARHRLEPQDRIEIGDTILVFKLVESV